MSSTAALQPAPHQPTSVASLNTPPLVPASPASRHYNSSHSSPTREAYHANQQGSTAPPSSSKRPSRKHSATDPVPSPLNSPMNSRTAITSPVPVAPAGSQEYRASPSDRRRNMPTAVPPRTSSTQHGQGSSGAGSSSRRQAYTTDGSNNSSRRSAAANGSADAGIYQDDATAQSSRSRRTHHGGQPSSNTRDSRQSGASTSVPIRTATTSSPKGPSREASEILNSILISQPEVDIEREKERLALAQPHHADEIDDEAAPPPVVAQVDQGDDARRGGRSRHDHSGKREKHTKFGEYILGNTIGEGEFGKVKLGWKQDGGVQVRDTDDI